jgi:hypothetical protein
VLGYSTGSAWFSYTDCPISPVTPPEGVVGFDQLFPEWNVIKAAYPDAQDAHSISACRDPKWRDAIIFVLKQPLQLGMSANTYVHRPRNTIPLRRNWLLIALTALACKEL